MLTSATSAGRGSVATAARRTCDGARGRDDARARRRGAARSPGKRGDAQRSTRRSALERVVVGTEATWQRVRRCGVVIFADFDQYLLAPRASARAAP